MAPEGIRGFNESFRSAVTPGSTPPEAPFTLEGHVLGYPNSTAAPHRVDYDSLALPGAFVGVSQVRGDQHAYTANN